MREQPANRLVPGEPGGLTIAVYRPGSAGQSTSSTLVETVTVDATEAIGQLIELLNGLGPADRPPSPGRLPTTGARDLLCFTYPDGGQRTIKVTRDGYRSVSVEGHPGWWGPIQPLHATIDTLISPAFRLEAGNPVAYPPSEHPEYIGEAEAIALALGGACSPPPAEPPPAYAGLMTRAETGDFDPALGANNYSPHPARKVWLVSVHVQTQTMGGPATPPRPVHGYSVVIDAEIGMVTDIGWGSAPFGKEKCPVCRQ